MFDPAVLGYARWFGERSLWETLRWRGVPVYKTPSDLWIYQELIVALRPGLIIEFGTKFGGSALFMADMLKLNNINGAVLTIDPDPMEHPRPQHSRVIYRTDDAQTRESLRVAIEMAKDVLPGSSVLVIEDAEHTYEVSSQLLMMYADLVTPGSYYIVEDTGLGYYDEDPLPGTARAAQEFVNAHPEWSIDWSMERFGHTVSHGGFLKRGF